MNPNFPDKVQSKPYDNSPEVINNADINSLKYSIISKIDIDDLNAEIAARKAGDIAVTNQTDAKLSSKANQSALNDEATVRQLADNVLQNSINSKASTIDLQNEVTERKDSFAKLSSTFNNTVDKEALTAEASLRLSGDVLLQTNIDNKVSQNVFNTEVNLRIAGDLEVKTLINNVSTGIGSALPTDVPALNIKTYNVSVAGTYTNFGGLTVTTGDTTSGLVQLQLNGTTWSKVVTPIALGNYATKTDLTSYSLNADILTVSPIISYKHPNGDSEYVGSSFFTSYASGWYVPSSVLEYRFNTLQMKVGVETGLADVYFRIYLTDSLNGTNPSNWTFIKEIVKSLDTNVDVLRDLSLDSFITVPSGKTLCVLASTQSAVRIKIKTWTNNTPSNRLPFVYTNSITQNSGIFNTVFYTSTLPNNAAVPMIVTSKYPFVYNIDYVSKIANIESALSSLSGSTGGYLSKSEFTAAQDNITYKHVNGDSEYVGNNSFGINGVAQLAAPQTSSYSFNQLSIKAGRATAGLVYIRVYTSPTLSAGVSPQTNYTLLVPEFTQTWNTSVDVFKVLDFASTYTVPANHYLIIAVSTKTATVVNLKRWTVNATNRIPFIFSANTDYTNIFDKPWTVADGPSGYYGVPVLAKLTVPYVRATDYNVKMVEIDNKFSTTPLDVNPRLIFPTTINVASGREFNLWNDALCVSYGDDVKVNYSSPSSSVGLTKERGFRHTGSVTGSTVITTTVKNRNNTQLATKTFSLKVVPKDNGSSSTKQIVFVGDSLTNDARFVQEVKNLVVADGGFTPFLLGSQGTTTKHEGRGGWTYGLYAGVGKNDINFGVNGVTTYPDINSTRYSINGSGQYLVQYTTTGQIKVSEIVAASSLPSTGVLNKLSGNGDSTITYSSLTVLAGNPFWNASSTSLDIKNWMSVNNNFGGTNTIDIAHFMCGTNETLNVEPIATTIANAKAVFNAFLDSSKGYPNCKIIVSMPPIACGTKDGFANNYGAQKDKENFEVAIRSLWEAIILNFDNGAFHPNVSVSASGLWVDRINGYDTATVPISSRFSTTTKEHINAVHPGASGYNQIADAVYSHIRAII